MILRVGQRVPDFTLPDSDERERGLSDFMRGGNTVIAFFLFAFSGECDREMCTFRDDAEELESLRAQVIGISVDSVFTLRVFGQTYGIGFPLLSDFNKKVIRAYGVMQDPWFALGYRGVSKRAIFVIDGRGVLRYRWIANAPSEEPPYGRVKEALAKLN